jgi:hypothetical protein
MNLLMLGEQPDNLIARRQAMLQAAIQFRHRLAPE